VLDGDLRERPDWVTGELYIGGVGLARGYFRDESQTSQRFIIHPKSGERLYRTGDLGRYLPSGEIEFLGREDNQVKIGGHRVELGEIEAQLMKHPLVKQAVVGVVSSAPLSRIIAYLVKSDSLADHDDLSLKLKVNTSDLLPNYMIPQMFVFLDSIPLSANGKLDRKQLPSLAEEMFSLDKEKPRNDADLELLNIFSLVLGIPIEEIGINDDFFILGGNSLYATQVLVKVQSAFNIQISINDFFQNSVIKKLSDLVWKQSGQKNAFP
ncbi:MAG: non-ribosomal peptide synthetase, partial [Gammaproteobacteria bacterium]|nr:non-ribosomal peptide synthetase [Gammaproteobacteria bacterium]